jgi:hypothetical protein
MMRRGASRQSKSGILSGLPGARREGVTKGDGPRRRLDAAHDSAEDQALPTAVPATAIT